VRERSVRAGVWLASQCGVPPCHPTISWHSLPPSPLPRLLVLPIPRTLHASDLQSSIVCWLQRHSLVGPEQLSGAQQLVTALTPAQHAAGLPSVCRAAVAAYVGWSESEVDRPGDVPPAVEACGSLLLSLLSSQLPGVPSTVHRCMVAHLRPRAGTKTRAGGLASTPASAAPMATSGGTVRQARLPPCTTTDALMAALGARVHQIHRALQEAASAVGPSAPSSDDADFAQPQSTRVASNSRCSVGLEASLQCPLDPLADALGACYVFLCTMPNGVSEQPQGASLLHALGAVLADLVVALTDGLAVARFLGLATSRGLGAGGPAGAIGGVSGGAGADGCSGRVGGHQGTLAPGVAAPKAPGTAAGPLGPELSGATGPALRAILPLYAFAASVFSDVCTSSLSDGGVPQAVLQHAAVARGGLLALFNRKHAMLTFRPLLGGSAGPPAPDASIVDPGVADAVVLALLETMQLVAAVSRSPINAADVLRDDYTFSVTLAGYSDARVATAQWAPLPLDVAESTLRSAVTRVGHDGDHAGYPSMSSCRVLEAVLGCVVGEAYQIAADAVSEAATGWSRGLHGSQAGARALPLPRPPRPPTPMPVAPLLDPSRLPPPLDRLSSLWHLVFSALRLHVELGAHMSPTVVLPCPFGLAARVLTVDFLAPFRVDVTTCLLQHLNPPAVEDRTVLVQALCLQALRAITAAVNVASLARHDPVLAPQLLWRGWDSGLLPWCAPAPVGPPAVPPSRGSGDRAGTEGCAAHSASQPQVAVFFMDRRDAACHSPAVAGALAAHMQAGDYRALYAYIASEGEVATQEDRGGDGCSGVGVACGAGGAGGGPGRAAGGGLRPGDGLLSLTSLWLATVLWRTLHSRMPAAVLTAAVSQVRWYMAAAVAWEGGVRGDIRGPSLSLLATLPALRGSFAEGGLPQRGPLSTVLLRTVPGRITITLLEILKRFPLRPSTVGTVLQAVLLVPELRPRCTLASHALRALLGVAQTTPGARAPSVGGKALIGPGGPGGPGGSGGPGGPGGPRVQTSLSSESEMWHLSLNLHFKGKCVGAVRLCVETLEDALNFAWARSKQGPPSGVCTPLKVHCDLVSVLRTAIADLTAVVQVSSWWEEEAPAQQPRFVACVCSLMSTVLAVVGGLLQTTADGFLLLPGRGPAGVQAAVEGLGQVVEDAGVDGLPTALGRLHSFKKLLSPRAPVSVAVAAFGRVVAATQVSLASAAQVWSRPRPPPPATFPVAFTCSWSCSPRPPRPLSSSAVILQSWEPGASSSCRLAKILVALRRGVAAAGLQSPAGVGPTRPGGPGGARGRVRGRRPPQKRLRSRNAVLDEWLAESNSEDEWDTFADLEGFITDDDDPS
jgi:hypothetical protein